MSGIKEMKEVSYLKLVLTDNNLGKNPKSFQLIS